jgi:hypothetical protein
MTIKLSETDPVLTQFPILTPFLEDFAKICESLYSLDKTSTVFKKNLKEINKLHSDLKAGLPGDQLQYFSDQERLQGNEAGAILAAEIATKLLKDSPIVGKNLQSTKGKEILVSDLKKNKRLLIEMYNVCTLSIAAKQYYYDYTWAGRVAQALQKIGQKLGFQTSLQKAQDTLEMCDQALQDQEQILSEFFSKHKRNQPLFKPFFLEVKDSQGLENKDYDKLENEGNLSSVVGIIRTCATLQKQNFYAALKEFPNHTLITKKNGDVIMIDKSMTGGKGAEKYVYKNNIGLLHSSISELLST